MNSDWQAPTSIFSATANSASHRDPAGLTATTQQTPAATGSQATEQAVAPGTQEGFYATTADVDMDRTEEEEGDIIPDDQMLNEAGVRVPRDEPLPPDSDDEDSPEAERIQAELAAAGVSGLMESLASSAVTVPPPITEIYREAYNIVRLWFVTELDEQQKLELVMINRKIRDWNTKNRIDRQLSSDYFPVRQLYPQVRLLKDAVDQFGTLPASLPEREEAVAKITTASYALLQQLRVKVQLNEDIRRVNQKYGIPQGDHTLPAEALLAEAAGLQSVTEAVQVTRRLLLIEDVTHQIDSGEPPSEAELQQVSLFVQDNDAMVGDANTPSSNSEAQSTTGAVSLSTAPSTPPSSDPPTQPTDGLDLSVFERISNRRELPTGNNLLTDFGKVTHTRKAGKDKYRVFVNASTDKRPFFHVLSGSEFPSDVAKEWYHATHSDTDDHDYLPRNRRKFVARVMYIVEVLGSGNESRQPITYYWTEFKPDPAHPEYPDEEWVIRSNLIIMVGKKQEEKWRAQLQGEREEISEIYETVKSKQLHPETGRKLTPQDLKNMPWLDKDALPIYNSSSVALSQPVKVGGWTAKKAGLKQKAY
ncbi:hypothetical protein H2201_008638 [Coniosporium apollinis]|uniref:Uncharacterized protein n=1 Tax=Coniosporium apollinis TaxID=61459 RepID=A0ABQ9NI54_9PEZI|nr:hypothetical protein H2201_008638 [Coniosporium apollinis]